MRLALRCLLVATVAMVVGMTLLATPAAQRPALAKSTAQSPRPVPAQSVPASMAEDERTAVAAMDEYWRRHFKEFFGGTYRSPRVYGGYVGTDGPSCNGDPAQPLNAFYCPPADFLAWDEELMALGYRRVGDAWVYLIIAHEWGHAIQARVNRRLVSVADELQADCLAGAALAGATRDRLIAIEPGDNQEIADSLIALADKNPWTSRRDHGDARQRVAAFNNGSRGGVRACF